MQPPPRPPAPLASHSHPADCQPSRVRNLSAQPLLGAHNNQVALKVRIPTSAHKMGDEGATSRSPPPRVIVQRSRRQATNRKTQKMEDHDADALDALRGYSALSRDETDNTALDPEHLKMSGKQELPGQRRRDRSPFVIVSQR
jgi:hypothetical protein